MIEEEAKTKRCCGPDDCGLANSAEPVYNMDGNLIDWRPLRWCVGAACMAWRWSLLTDKEGFMVSSPRENGYCGLAGRIAERLP